jgi:hypothetical protein
VRITLPGIVKHRRLLAEFSIRRSRIIETDGEERFEFLHDAALVVINLPAAHQHARGFAGGPLPAGRIAVGERLIDGQSGVAEQLGAEDDVLRLRPRLQQTPKAVGVFDRLDRFVAFRRRNVDAVRVVDAANAADRGRLPSFNKGAEIIDHSRARRLQGIAGAFTHFAHYGCAGHEPHRREGHGAAVAVGISDLARL